MHLGKQSDQHQNKKKIQAITQICGKQVSASALKQDLGMSSRRLAVFLKRIEEISRFKKYNTYRYEADPNDIPDRIEYGKYWVEIEQKEDEIVIKNSEGDERTIKG